MQFEEVTEYFIRQGAKLFVTPEQLKNQLLEVDTFLFDWDGVFNDGTKSGHQGSVFSEPDSMGTNMMRLSHYLRTGRIPVFGILTGAQNEIANHFAHREHFDFIVRGIKQKQRALDLILDQFKTDPTKALFAWDDILDLPVAKWAATSMQIRRDVNPMMDEFAAAFAGVTYRTSVPGNRYAVREISELYLAAAGNAHECFEARLTYSEAYQTYLRLRNQGQTLEIQESE